MTSSEPQPAEMLDAVLGKYRVVERLGEGGMGVVYVGRHETLGHRVAVKVLRLELSRNADMVRRFFNEAQAATAIRHPGIVQIFDHGTTPDGRAYFVMELLEGQTLGARLDQRRLDYVECCRLGRQVANVMQAAHTAGITHRDLKPDNLFFVSDTEVAGGERVKVLDFGIAKLAGEVHAAGVKTRTGLVMGTPVYMSPEQCRGAGAVDARSDIYSLGCILFEVACGRPPFIGEGAGEIVGAHQHVPPPSPQSLAPDIPADLAGLISKMLAKRPEARPPAMAAVSQALDEILSSLGPPTRAQASSPVLSSKATPARALAPSPVPQISPASTTLGGSAGATSARDLVRRHRLPFLLGGITAAGAIAAAVAFVAAGSSSSEAPVARDESATASRRGDAAVAAPATAPPATPAPAQPAATAANDEVQTECLRYQKSESWGALDTCADRLRPLNPSLALELENRAEQEIRSAPRIRGVEAALQDKDLKRAKAELDQIWTGSTSYQPIKLKYDNLEVQVINNLVARLQRSSSCEEYQALLAQARAANPPRIAAEAALRVKCTRGSPVGCDPEVHAKKGRDLHAAGQLGAALESFEEAWLCKQDSRYAEKAFIIACNMRALGKARVFWRRMSPSLQERTMGVCVRNQITEEMLDAP